MVVVDERSNVAKGTSYANAGRFVPTLLFSYPQASPQYITGMMKTALKNVEQWVTNSSSEAKKSVNTVDVPSSVEPSLELIRRGLYFMRSCTPDRYAKNHALFQDLSVTCIKAMDSLCSDIGVKLFEPGNKIEARADNIWVFATAEQMDVGLKKASLGKRVQGLDYTKMDVKTCCKNYEFLTHHLKDTEAGGCVVSHGDWLADAGKFTQAVAKACEKLEVEFLFNTPVDSLVVDRDETGRKRVRGVRVGEKKLGADAVVLCTGAEANYLLEKDASTSVPLMGMKGCSIDFYDVENAPTEQVSDYTSGKLNYQASPFPGNRLRVTGFADIVSCKRATAAKADAGVQCEPHYEDSLLRYTKSVFPDLKWKTRRPAWCGIRPMTPDDLPIVGDVPRVKKLYVNLGHGSSGWTFSAGTGMLAASHVLKGFGQLTGEFKTRKDTFLKATRDCVEGLDDISGLSMERFAFL